MMYLYSGTCYMAYVLIYPYCGACNRPSHCMSQYPISANSPNVLAPPGPPCSQTNVGAFSFPFWGGKYHQNKLFSTAASVSKNPENEVILPMLRRAAARAAAVPSGVVSWNTNVKFQWRNVQFSTSCEWHVDTCDVRIFGIKSQSLHSWPCAK